MCCLPALSCSMQGSCSTDSEDLRGYPPRCYTHLQLSPVHPLRVDCPPLLHRAGGCASNPPAGRARTSPAHSAASPGPRAAPSATKACLSTCIHGQKLDKRFRQRAQRHVLSLIAAPATCETRCITGNRAPFQALHMRHRVCAWQNNTGGGRSCCQHSSRACG